jgi:hypothetical protein
MDVKFENLPGTVSAIVYVRPVLVSDLPAELQAQVEGLETLYAVHRPDGARLALVADRNLAFALARQNDMAPVSVH